MVCREFRSFNGLHCANSLSTSGKTLNFASINLVGCKSSISIKGIGKSRAALVSDQGDLLSYSNGKSNGIDSNSVRIELQSDAVAFGTLAADTAPISSGFPIDNDEYELDRPTEGFASIPEAIEDIRQGKVNFFCSFIFAYLAIY